jgi:hypothetical protein|tara:strand:- start:1219 stop:1557 length:339 start_codon:yes stop_codon:yes gene_type:complete
MKFQEYVESNQTVIQFVKDAMPGENDKYTGTLDYATARFNTILLRLSEDPLKADRHSNDLQECFHAIQSFYKYTLRLNTWPVIMKPIIKLILHYKGTFQIPKIKFLLEKINN